MSSILIVDDDEDMRETLRALLEDADYLVRDAEDGLTAIDILRKTFDRMVVLVDMAMPRLDGGGVLRLVACDPDLATRHAYVIYSASEAPLTPELIQILADLDCPIIPKSAEMELLLDAVQRATDRLWSETNTPLVVPEQLQVQTRITGH
jgi:CheY-like chemotaxis protein